jgi:hypothetical protein
MGEKSVRNLKSDRTVNIMVKEQPNQTASLIATNNYAVMDKLCSNYKANGMQSRIEHRLGCLS